TVEALFQRAFREKTAKMRERTANAQQNLRKISGKSQPNLRKRPPHSQGSPEENPRRTPGASPKHAGGRSRVGGEFSTVMPRTRKAWKNRHTNWQTGCGPRERPTAARFRSGTPASTEQGARRTSNSLPGAPGPANRSQASS